MTAVRLGISELRRISAGTLPKLAILAMIVIPTLYSGLYLFANENPYDKLEEVPAALVVQDRGATVENATDGTSKETNFGEQVAKQLLDGDGGFGWIETSQADAEVGVRSGRFDAALIIGPTFSEDLASSGKFEPRQASLTLITNDANNYLAATIADKIVGKVRDSIAEQVGTEAADTFLQGFASIHTNLASGVDGAQKLVDGAAQLSDGTVQLVDGTAQLASGRERPRAARRGSPRGRRAGLREQQALLGREHALERPRHVAQQDGEPPVPDAGAGRRRAAGRGRERPGRGLRTGGSGGGEGRRRAAGERPDGRRGPARRARRLGRPHPGAGGPDPARGDPGDRRRHPASRPPRPRSRVRRRSSTSSAPARRRSRQGPRRSRAPPRRSRRASRRPRRG
ncbi:YhgE/Pip family protein [Oerskovia sp. M15]